MSAETLPPYFDARLEYWQHQNAWVDAAMADDVATYNDLVSVSHTRSLAHRALLEGFLHRLYWNTLAPLTPENEGWACAWARRLVSAGGELSTSDVVQHAAWLASPSLWLTLLDMGLDMERVSTDAEQTALDSPAYRAALLARAWAQEKPADAPPAPRARL